MGAACCGGASVEEFPELTELGCHTKVSATEHSSKALIRDDSSYLSSGGMPHSNRHLQHAHKGAASMERRPSSFNASAVPASPSLSKKSAVPFVSEGSNACYSLNSLSNLSQSNSLCTASSASLSGAFGEPGSSTSGNRRNLRITWCEVKEVAVFRV